MKVFSRSLARLFSSQCVAGGEELRLTEDAVLGRCEVITRFTIEVTTETTDFVAHLAAKRQLNTSTIIEDGQSLLTSDQQNGAGGKGKDLNLVAIVIFKFSNFLVGDLDCTLVYLDGSLRAAPFFAGCLLV